MSLTNQHPNLHPFVKHGFDVIGSSGDHHVYGHCPFCDKDKLYINIQTNGWDCKYCNRSGGIGQFLYQRSCMYANAITPSQLSLLADNRKLDVNTLIKWHVGWDGVQYTIPVPDYVKNDCLLDIRLYNIGSRTMSTKGCKANIGWNRSKGIKVWICEGEWDAMVLDEVFTKLRRMTAVYYVPGMNVFPKSAAQIFAEKDLILLYDNQDNATKAMVKVAQKMSGIAKSVSLIAWPAGLEDNYDIRDLYNDCELDPKRTLSSIESMIAIKPVALSATETTNERLVVTYTKGLDRSEVIEAYRQSLHMPDTTPIDIVYGAIFANRIPGDPLWLFLVSPPGGGKTELLMGLDGSQFIHTEDTIKPAGLISGFNTGEGDPSLIPKLNGKVLIVKDFTSILSMPSNIREELFGILRAAYDGKCERTFGNKTRRSFYSTFGILGAVTPIIERFASTHALLGERFIRYNIRRESHIRSSDVLIRRAISNVGIEPEIQKRLREMASIAIDREVKKEDIPSLPSHLVTHFIRLAQWVARLRSLVVRNPYTREVQHIPSAEVATRLGKQLVKLAMGIAIFRGKKEVTMDEYYAITDVAKSTCPDRVEAIVRAMYLHNAGSTAFSSAEIAHWVNLPQSTISSVMNDMSILHITKKDQQRWRLSPTLNNMITKFEIYKKEVIARDRRKERYDAVESQLQPED